MKFKGTVLSVGAHPDDHDFSWGGYLAEAALAGYRVICLILTRGENGKIDGTRWPNVNAAKLRTAEQITAARFLGVHKCIFWDFPDGDCHSIPEIIAIRKLAKVIRQYVPTIVITYDDDGLTFHPDHIYASRITTAAYRLVRPAKSKLLHYAATDEWIQTTHAPLIAAGAMTKGNRPFVVPRERLESSQLLPAHVYDRKLRAIRAHDSQVTHLATFLGPELEPLSQWFSHEAFVQIA
jgi:LmbE family N-acetylglucosaminyl deacetylase